MEESTCSFLQVHAGSSCHPLRPDVFWSPVHARDPSLAHLPQQEGEGVAGPEEDSSPQRGQAGIPEHTQELCRILAGKNGSVEYIPAGYSELPPIRPPLGPAEVS